MSRHEEQREAFVVAEHPRLVRAAYLLTGSRAHAQDLAQEAVVRILSRWPAVRAADNPQAYTRRILLNLYLQGQQRANGREVPHADVPDWLASPDDTAAADSRDLLRRALASLPPRQRAAVILRQYEQLTERETADVLGCSVGNVKSLTSRGLAVLRAEIRSAEGARR